METHEKVSIKNAVKPESAEEEKLSGKWGRSRSSSERRK